MSARNLLNWLLCLIESMDFNDFDIYASLIEHGEVANFN